MKKKSNSTEKGQERRRSPRTEVLESFQVFLVVPKLGMQKIYLKDISERGMGFYTDESMSLTVGTVLDGSLNINPSLRLPLQLKVVRVAETLVGCEVTDAHPGVRETLIKFVALLDDLAAFLE